MTTAQLKTALKRYGFDDGDPLLEWLNAALHDIEDAYDWPWLQNDATITIPAGDLTSAVLPSDFFKPITLKDRTKDYKLKPKTRQWWEDNIDDETDVGAPEFYTQLAIKSLDIWRVPDVETTLYLVYQKEISDLAIDADVPAIPVRLHYPIVMRAASIGLMAENEENRAETAQSSYESTLDRAISKYTYTDLDEFETVTDQQEYGGNTF